MKKIYECNSFTEYMDELLKEMGYDFKQIDLIKHGCPKHQMAKIMREFLTAGVPIDNAIVFSQLNCFAKTGELKRTGYATFERPLSDIVVDRIDKHCNAKNIDFYYDSDGDFTMLVEMEKQYYMYNFRVATGSKFISDYWDIYWQLERTMPLKRMAFNACPTLGDMQEQNLREGVCDA